MIVKVVLTFAIPKQPGALLGFPSPGPYGIGQRLVCDAVT